jgi:hypothetical protein
MRTVRNKSEKTFIDGDLMIDGGQTAEISDDRAEILLRDYAWQFEESSAKSAKTEDELKTEQRQNPVQPIQDAEDHGTRNEHGDVKKTDK